MDGASADRWVEGIGSIRQNLLAPLAPLSNGSNYTLNVFNASDGQTIYRAPVIDGEEGEQRLDTWNIVGIINGIEGIPTNGSSHALLEYYRRGELIYKNHSVVGI